MALTVPQALQLLQLEPGATRKQIRAAYKRLALQLHPDKQQQQRQQSADATAAFALLSAAYSLLLQGHGLHVSEQDASEAAVLPPFETAYATGSLFSEQLLDEAVLMGCCPADISTLQQLSRAVAEGQLAQHLATHPPSAAEETLWKQAYTRLELRQSVKQQALQQQQQQPGPQEQGQQAGVCVGQLLSDLLLRPAGPLFVEDSEAGSDTEDSSDEGPHTAVSLQQGVMQQQQQRQQCRQLVVGSKQHLHRSGVDLATPSCSKQQDNPSQPCPATAAARTNCKSSTRQQQQQQQPLNGTLQLSKAPQHQQQQAGVTGSCRAKSQSKQLRHGWGFYWTWLRRALLAKALLSVLTSSIWSQLHEHHFPQPLPL